MQLLKNKVTSFSEISQLCPLIFVKLTVTTRVITERLIYVNRLLNTADSLIPIITETIKEFLTKIFIDCTCSGTYWLK